jgi:pyridoxine 4-dehydrogenase
MKIDAKKSGTFAIGGELTVHRLGFGAMRVVGDGVWGPPRDEAEALRVLRRLPDLGIDFIDTADSYGPKVSEELIAKALHPYPRGLVIATKAGFTRSGPNRWTMNGRPEHLRASVEGSLQRLRVDRIDLWQLHRIDPKVPRAEQFDAIEDLRRRGLIRHVGLSEVSVEDIAAARRRFPVATVQNLYNVADRTHEDVLDTCAREGIGFIPWYPLAAGDLAQPGGVVDVVAKKLGATPSQIALAWLLKRSPVMLPIPGTGSVAHLDENTAAAHVALTDDDFDAIKASGS